MLERHKTLFSSMPRKFSADGGFTSKDNLATAKEFKVKDVVFFQEAWDVNNRHGQEHLGVQKSTQTSEQVSKLTSPRSRAPSSLTAPTERDGRDSTIMSEVLCSQTTSRLLPGSSLKPLVQAESGIRYPITGSRASKK